MAKINIPKIESSTFRGWAFVLVAGIALTVLALVDRGGLDQLRSSADGSTGCQMEVAADELNVRAGPSQVAELVQVLHRGDQVDAVREVTAGFRRLADGNWASEQFLAPLPGTNCA